MDWDSLADLKAESWIERQRARTPNERLAAAGALLVHRRAVRPDPSLDDRIEDREAHTRLSQRMRDADPL